MNAFPCVGLAGLLLSLLALASQHECTPFFWFPPSFHQSSNTASATSTGTASPTQQQSNVSVALGNRVNTNTGLDDYGTNVDGVGVNILRRRRRDTWDIPGLLLNGSSPRNGSYIAIGDRVFQLPDQLSNVSLNVFASSSSSSPGVSSADSSLNLTSDFIPAIPRNYTDAFRALVTQSQTLPLDTLDSIVQFLALGYGRTFGQSFVEDGFGRLNRTLEYGRAVVQSTLSSLVDQSAQGFEQLARSFNRSTSRVQRCVGSQLNPRNASQAILGRAFGCVNDKWEELARLAGNIAGDLVAADQGARQFLGNLTACNGGNFGESEQRSSLRRQCYVRAVGAFPQSLLFLPVSLSIDAARLYASVQSLEVDVAVCGSQMAAEIGLIVGQIGTKILLCQVFPPS